MNPVVGHRIRRLRWRVRTASAEEAFVVRARLRGAVETTLLGEFERAFDEASTGGELVHLERIELSARLSDIGQVESSLGRLLRHELDERLAAIVRGGAATGGRDRASADSSEQQSRAKVHDLDLLREYLLTGVLPWELAGPPAPDVRRFLQELASRTWPDLIRETSRLEPDKVPPFFFRLLQLLPGDRWMGVAERLPHRLGADRAALLVGALATLGSGMDAGASYGAVRTASVLLAAAIARTGHDQLRLLSTIATAGSGPPDLPAASAGQWRPHSPVVGLVARWVRQLEGERPSATPPAAPASHARAGALAARGAPDATPADRAEDAGDAPRDPFGMIVEQAGLVLLHPFLPRFLEAIGVVMSGGASLIPDELPRAAAVLQWLATGEENGLEFETTFIKILIGLRPDTPQPVSAGLVTETDRRESDALLQAVIAQWPGLGSTSAEALRVSFLGRGGLLREGEDGWRLQVEPRGFDALLKRLPWPIGVVKLPWMKKPIFTEWTPP